MTVTALCATDVQNAVGVARERDMRIAVQATGHGTLTACDGGMLIDTSAMREVLLDPDRRMARVGPGATWGDVIAAAAPFGLAPLSGTDPSVGVTGYTLGGGFGWLSRRYGFAADSVVKAHVVTADARRLVASADREAELFWALRGGGGNFGVVTSLEVRLFPVARVLAGTALFPRERADDLLAAYAGWNPSDDVNVSVLVRPDAVAIRGLTVGDSLAELAPLLAAAGDPTSSDWRPMPFAEVTTIGGTAPRAFEMLDELDPEAILAADAAAVEVRQWGGAIARAGSDGGPAGHRDTRFAVTVDGDAGPIAAGATGGSFLNFLKDVSRTPSAYTAENYALLRDLKRAYDPRNVFGHVHNIAPARFTLPRAELELTA